MTNSEDFLSGLLKAIQEGTPKEGAKEMPFAILEGLPSLESLLKGLGKQEGEETPVNPFEEILKGLGKQEGEETSFNPFEEILKGLGKQEGEETPVNPFEEILKGLGKQEGEETPFNPLDAILKGLGKQEGEETPFNPLEEILKGTLATKKEEMIASILEKIFASTECEREFECACEGVGDCSYCAGTPTPTPTPTPACGAECACQQEQETNDKGVSEFFTKTDDGEVEKLFIQLPLVAVSKENVEIEIEKGFVLILATPDEFVGHTGIPFVGNPTIFKKFYPELENSTFTTEASLQQGVLTLIVTFQKEAKETVRVSIA